MIRLAILFITVSTLALTAADVLACGGSVLTEYMFQPDTDAKIEFVRPVPEGSDVVRSDLLEIYVTYSEDRAGALTPLDHIHYGLGKMGEGKAEQGEFTMPDLTGRVRLYFPNPDDNGTYEVCAYLARADHSHLSETACATFELANSGMRLYLPRNDASYALSEVAFQFDTYGSDVSYIEYTIGDGDVQRIDPAIVSLDLPPLENGTHTLVVKAFDSTDKQLGATITRTFTVDSALTALSANKLTRFLKRARKNFWSAKGETLLKKAKRLAKKMKKSAGVSADNTNLDDVVMKQVLRLINQGIKQNSPKKLKKAMRILKRALE